MPGPFKAGYGLIFSRWLMLHRLACYIAPGAAVAVAYSHYGDRLNVTFLCGPFNFPYRPYSGDYGQFYANRGYMDHFA